MYAQGASLFFFAVAHNKVFMLQHVKNGYEANFAIWKKNSQKLIFGCNGRTVRDILLKIGMLMNFVVLSLMLI